MSTRSILAAGAAAVLTMAIALPANAGQRDGGELLAERSGAAYGLGQVTLKKFTESNRTYASLVDSVAPDVASADEWDLVLHRDLTCSSAIASYAFAFTEAYGPRINVFEVTPPYTLDPGPNQALTAELVHQGPNFEDHAPMPGLHSVACITLG